MADDYQHIVLLNWLVSQSTTRARGHTAPTHSGHHLIDILRGRCDKQIAIEYVKAEDDADETKRRLNGAGRSFIRLYDMSIIETDEYKYVAMLLKYVDSSVTTFSVEDMERFTGREIAGSSAE